ncbi:MAG: hypothetical protein ACRCX4_05555 [Bacteroidales bacterium]
MHKTKTLFVSFVAICLSVMIASSFVNKDARPGVGFYPGSSFPDFSILGKNSQLITKDSLKGNYLLIQFWAAYDADSRMKNVQLCNSLNRPDSKIKFLSVPMDPYNQLSRETIRLDRIPESNVFFPDSNQREKLLSEQALKGKLTNFLIDPDGVIIAQNVTAKELAQIKM